MKVFGTKMPSEENKFNEKIFISIELLRKKRFFKSFFSQKNFFTWKKLFIRSVLIEKALTKKNLLK